MNSSQDPMNPQQSSGMMSDQRYSVMLPGLDEGTYSVSELSAMAISKVIQPHTKVQPEGQDYTILANDIPGLYSHKSWMVALLLSVFLGFLAVDRFYMGRIGLGILKLLFGFGIWWIIDIILIATRTARTKDGLPLGL